MTRKKYNYDTNTRIVKFNVQTCVNIFLIFFYIMASIAQINTKYTIITRKCYEHEKLKENLGSKAQLGDYLASACDFRKYRKENILAKKLIYHR